jgi:hypothetical protein
MTTSESTSTPKKLTTCIFERIEAEQVCPRPRWFFHSRECVVWTLWLLSVIVGALAVAVTLYTLTVRQYALYEVTHGSFWWSLAAALPYVWLVAFVGMVVFAVYNLRHTKRGYRYPLWQIIVSSMVVSVGVGGALHTIGWGHLADTMLGERWAMYQSQQKYERALWQQPSAGRLVATMVGSTSEPHSIIMRDVDGVEWVVDMASVSKADHDLLQSGLPVKVLGMVHQDTAGVFTACGSAAWYFHQPMRRRDLYAEREAFWGRIAHQRRRLTEQISASTAIGRATSTQHSPSCADLDVMHLAPER